MAETRRNPCGTLRNSCGTLPPQTPLRLRALCAHARAKCKNRANYGGEHGDHHHPSPRSDGMTTRQPIRRRSWGAWFPIVRGEDADPGPMRRVVEWGELQFLPTDIEANRKRWGMKP